MEKTGVKKPAPKKEEILTKYEIPTKKLKSPMDLATFVKGKSYTNIMTFISEL